MSLSDLKQLPLEVQELIFSAQISKYNGLLADQFALNQDQLDFVLNLEEDIWLKKVSVLDLPRELEEMERAEYYDLRNIALEIAYKILWPLQDYLGDVDRLILRLGGRVPRAQRLRKKSGQQSLKSPTYLKGAIKILLEQYPDFKDKRLSAKKITSKDGRKVSPSVDNWLKDYVHFLGASYHNSLQRAKYLAKNPNILATEQTERETLRHFFTSYEDGLLVEVDASDVVLKIKAIKEEQPEEKKTDIQETLALVHQAILDLDKKMINTNLILSEAGNSLHKLRDVLWLALGIQDQDKVISCLKTLIEKKALDLMLQEDKRFQGLLRRFVSVRYGANLVLDYHDKLLTRRLFLELILTDKLHLLKPQSSVVAYYLTNLTSEAGQIVYLDTLDQQLKWRELQVVKNKFAWVDNI
jgi:hypothetical protein